MTIEDEPKKELTLKEATQIFYSIVEKLLQCLNHKGLEKCEGLFSTLHMLRQDVEELQKKYWTDLEWVDLLHIIDLLEIGIKIGEKKEQLQNSNDYEEEVVTLTQLIQSIGRFSPAQRN